nr:vegetative cell wall protein gp1-like [Lolium perenne]
MSGELRPAPSSLGPAASVPVPARRPPPPPHHAPASSAVPRVAKPRRPPPPPCPGELRAFPSPPRPARVRPARVDLRPDELASASPARVDLRHRPCVPARGRRGRCRPRPCPWPTRPAGAPPMPRADGSATARARPPVGRRGQRLPHPCPRVADAAGAAPPRPRPVRGRRGRPDGGAAPFLAACMAPSAAVGMRSHSPPQIPASLASPAAASHRSAAAGLLPIEGIIFTEVPPFSFSSSSSSSSPPLLLGFLGAEIHRGFG